MFKKLEIQSTSLVNHENQQRIILNYQAYKTCHLKITVTTENKTLIRDLDVGFTSGKCTAFVMLPAQKQAVNSVWKFYDANGTEVFTCTAKITPARDWTIFFMISSHTDIGLHNSQYIQRYNSVNFIDEAAKLSEQTKNEKQENRYKYIAEGTWFWNNYPMDKGQKAARKIVEEQIKTGNFGVCCGVAGNTMQTLGLEELCRFANERKNLEKNWGIKCETMSMIDFNGLPLSIIQPLSDAGYKNIIFSPNHWHPKNSTVWQRNLLDDTYPWNTDAGGSGSRIDFRYDSELPMLFFWENDNGERLLVAGSTQYDNSGVPFGVFNKPQPALINRDADYIPYAEIKTAKTLRALEDKYDFNVWLLPCYSDDQRPNLWMHDKIKEWNEKWKYPKFYITGNPDQPFNVLRENFYDKIPVVKGDITGGWLQLHPSITDFSTKKYETDRLLPIAEKYSTLAAITDKNFSYPKTQFDRAWNNLLYNDEHSYGASGYRGRKVHETWCQHRDWVDKSYYFSTTQINTALNSLCKKIKTSAPSIVVFNPTNQPVKLNVKTDNDKKFARCSLPKFGYKVIPKTEFLYNETCVYETETPPIIENEYYKISFGENGSIQSIFDKSLHKELLDLNNAYKCNEIIYTKDDHKSFSVPQKALFTVQTDCDGTSVTVKTAMDSLGAEIKQKITLCSIEKRIIISNSISHAKDMYNFSTAQTYKRFIYIAFPFMVENAKRLCHLNGAVIEYAKDVSGHCTDTYASVHDWCTAHNDNVGVALLLKQPQLVEYDHIHADKSDYGNAGIGSQIFCYVANDWLQMHVAGGDELNYQLDYAITSFDKTFDNSAIDRYSERFLTPIHTVELQEQNAIFKDAERTFIDFNTRSRFISLKPADDDKGLIARFYGRETEQKITNLPHQKVTVDERVTNKTLRKGFYTYKIEDFKIKNQKQEKPRLNKEKPLPIGSHYTGLIDKPKAANGEKNGQIYLLWGANRESNLSHYELYRSPTPNFKANAKTFVAKVFPEPYVVARYSDEGLKDYTRYYYKVRAVNKNGMRGELSEEFSAKTKQPLP